MVKEITPAAGSFGIAGLLRVLVGNVCRITDPLVERALSPSPGYTEGRDHRILDPVLHGPP